MKGFIAGSVLGLCAGLGIAACVGLPSQDAIGQEALPEPPAYMIVLGEVFDRPAFMEGYAAKLAPLYAEHGGAYLAIGGGPAIEVLDWLLDEGALLVLARRADAPDPVQPDGLPAAAVSSVAPDRGGVHARSPVRRAHGHRCQQGRVAVRAAVLRG